MLFLYAIIAMFCWSGSDLFSKMGTKLNDKFSHLKVGIAVGLIMGFHAIYEVTFGNIPLTLNDIWIYLPASALYILSMVIGYIGLRYIELSVSSPICNCSGAFALIMNIAYFGVKWAEDDSDAIFLNGPIISGVIFIIVGIISLGIIDYYEDSETRAIRQSVSNRKYSKSLLAIILPVLYCILDSLGTFVDTIIADNYTASLMDTNAMDEVSAELLCGDILNTAYEFTWLFMAIIFALYVFVIKKEKIDFKFDGIKTIGGICETIGQVFYMMVVVSDYKVGLVIISAYCAVSFLWSAIFLKEKLSYKHYLALAAVFLGIFILGFYDV